MAVTRVLRTTVDDDLFIRMDVALGVPVVNQMVWRLREPPSADELDRFAERLARGRLARLLRRSRIPLLRDHWVPGGAVTGGVHVEESPIPPGEAVAWIDAAAARSFDLRHGPVWEMRAAPVAGVGCPGVGLPVARGRRRVRGDDRVQRGPHRG